MRHARRRLFAAPLVMVSALPGCSSKQNPDDVSAGAAYLHRDGTACTYSVEMRCPEGAMCNPPPPRAVECPVGMGSGDHARVSRAAGKPDECVLFAQDCASLDCATPTPCLDPGFEALPAIQWAINPTEDGRCSASPAARTRFHGPGEPVAIDCPPSLADKHGFIERANPTASCVACATSPCDATAAAVPCPAAPAAKAP